MSKCKFESLPYGAKVTLGNGYSTCTGCGHRWETKYEKATHKGHQACPAGENKSRIMTRFTYDNPVICPSCGSKSYDLFEICCNDDIALIFESASLVDSL